MRTKDVKVNSEYLYNGETVTVIKRIQGEETTRRQMQSGELFTGMHRKRKSFLLSNGETIYSDNLKQLDHEN